MSIRRLLAITGAIVAVALAGAVMYLWMADLRKYKPQIEAAVSDATGRQFRIDGAFELDILPSPRVSIENATLANADWGSEPDMARIGRFSARVGLWSLVFRPIVLHDLQLHDVAVLLETSDTGEGNWVMGEPATPEPETDGSDAGLESPIDIRHAEISDVGIAYRAADTDDIAIALASMNVAVNGEGRHVVQGNGQLSKLPFTIDGTAGDRNVELNASLGEVKLRSTARYSGDSVDFTVSLATLDKAGALIDVDGLPTEDLALEGNVSADGESVRVADLVVTLGDSRVQGDIDVHGDGTASIAIDGGGSSLATLNGELPDIAFTIAAKAGLADGAVEVDPFRVTFGDSDIAGALSASGGERPRIELDAESTQIDLAPFATDSEQGAADPASTSTEKGDGERYVFTEEPLPLDSLRAANARIDVSIDTLKTSTLLLRELRTQLSAEDGKIELNTVFEGLAGGTFEHRIGVISDNETAELTLSAKVRDLRLGMLSGPEVPADEIPLTNLELDISANGATARALAASTGGRIVLTQGPGRVRHDLIDTLSGDIIAQLFSALNPFAQDEEYSNWECTVLTLDFDDGLGEVGSMLLQSQKLTVVGGGKIDLNSEKLDLEFNTKPRAGVGVSADMFVTPFVKLSGTLAEPGVGLNEKGILLAGGAAALTGGMSFLYQGLMDRATAEQDRCPQALEEASVSAVTDQ